MAVLKSTDVGEQFSRSVDTSKKVEIHIENEDGLEIQDETA